MLTIRRKMGRFAATWVAAIVSFLVFGWCVEVRQVQAECGDYVIMLGSHESNTSATPRQEHRESRRFATPSDSKQPAPPCHGPLCEGNDPVAQLPPLDSTNREGQDQRWIAHRLELSNDPASHGRGWCWTDEEAPAFFNLAGIDRPPRG